MRNRYVGSPISDYHYYVFEEIEKKGLQFCIPEEYRKLYKTYLHEKKIRILIDECEKARDRFFASQNKER